MTIAVALIVSAFVAIVASQGLFSLDRRLHAWVRSRRRGAAAAVALPPAEEERERRSAWDLLSAEIRLSEQASRRKMADLSGGLAVDPSTLLLYPHEARSDFKLPEEFAYAEYDLAKCRRGEAKAFAQPELRGLREGKGGPSPEGVPLERWKWVGAVKVLI